MEQIEPGDRRPPGRDHVRWGILSTADIALRKVIPGLRRSPRSDVVAIASRSDGRPRPPPPSCRSRARTAPTRRCSTTRTSTPSTSRSPTTSTVVDDRCGAGRQARPVREAARVTAARPEGWSTPAGRPASSSWRPSCTGSTRPGSRRGSSSRPAGSADSRPSTAGSRTSTTTRPTSGTSRRRRRRAVRHRLLLVNLSRMLFGAEPTRVQATITRDPALGVDTIDERHPRVRGRGRDVHLLHPSRDGPAGAHLRDGGPDLDRDPVQHPAGSPDAGLRDAGGDPPVAPATETLTFETADPYACEADPLRRRGPRRRAAPGSSPADAWPTCG